METTVNSTLLLDVDGVLCPWTDEPCVGYERFSYSDPNGEGAWDWISQQNGEHIRSLMEIFEIVWCTARDIDVLTTIGPAHDLPEFEVIEFGTEHLSNGRSGIRLPMEAASQVAMGGTWKLPWVHRWAYENRVPIAWIDDDLRDDAQEWADDRSSGLMYAGYRVPTLLVRPDPAEGLTQAHVDLLSGWGLEHSP